MIVQTRPRDVGITVGELGRGFSVHMGGDFVEFRLCVAALAPFFTERELAGGGIARAPLPTCQ